MQAKLVNLLPGTETAVVFLRAFFIIMGREWTNIDRHRIDKFYFLVRKTLGQTFEFLRARDWDAELVNEVAGDIAKVALSPAGSNPKGLKWFVIEKYVAQLKEASETTQCPPGACPLST